MGFDSSQIGARISILILGDRKSPERWGGFHELTSKSCRVLAPPSGRQEGGPPLRCFPPAAGPAHNGGWIR
jgi:hypothetical protein